MTVKKKILVSVIIFTCCLAGFLFYKERKGEGTDEGFIINDKKSIAFSSAATADRYRTGSHIPEELARIKVKDKHIKPGPDTLLLMRFLMRHYPECTEWNCNFEKAKKYLYENFSVENAKELFELYERFIECEDKVRSKNINLSGTQSIDEMIDMIRIRHDLRRQILGAELADALFGAEVKMQEYKLRKSVILSDGNLYGAQKEEKIKSLDIEMWDESASTYDDRLPYVKYQEQLEIFKKDIDEASSPEEQSRILGNLRAKCFDAQIVELMQMVDAELDVIKLKKGAYEEARKAITEDPALDEKQKEEKIRALQKNMFDAEYAERIRRMENMEKARDALR